jgi:neutral ceramidase
MQVGHAVRDITPPPGLTLSGFAARCNQPSRGVDDPLEVHALAIEGDKNLILLLVLDLLGLGRQLTVRLRAAIHRALRVSRLSRADLILCCTHTHSAPATIKVLGCGIRDASFWDHVAGACSEAAVEAVRNLRPALASYTTASVAGLSYNRRTVLEDGRVVMAAKPDQPVLKQGPIWDRALLLRFCTPDGDPVAGVVSWAAHPCVVCSLNISADYPGELRRSLSDAFGLPFMFLQGPCGNINLRFHDMNRAEMLENAQRITPHLIKATWSSPASSWPVDFTTRKIALKYAPLPEPAEVEAIRDAMARISETGTGPESTMLLLANILNIEPGAARDSALVRHTAATVAQWSSEVLERTRSDVSVSLAVNLLRIGPVWLVFAAAELFAETALALQAGFPEGLVTPIAYASPLVGYLPTDEALDEGGYEVDFAYKFYGHPAPFARGSEPKARATIEKMMRSMQGKRT